jgi:3,4-dihydroxy 2-butanone 4-phosphate synthase/GTP cyclohydrolase II
MTNNPEKIEALKKLGIKVTGRIPVESVAHDDNVGYLKTKAKKMSHMLFEPKK